MIDMSKKSARNHENPEINREVVFVPEGTTKIPDNFFVDCDKLERVLIPDTVEYIGEGAFFGCTALKRIDLPSQLKEIGRMTFWKCTNLRHINIPDTVTKIGNDCFAHSGLETIVLPSQLEVIEECAFSECKNLHSIVIPESVREIHNRAFGGSGLQSVRVPAGVKTVGEGAFESCESLTDITICSQETRFVKNMLPMFRSGEDGYKLHGEGYTLHGKVRIMRTVIACIIPCCCGLYGIIAEWLYCVFKYRFGKGRKKMPWSEIFEVEFFRRWYERVPTLDGNKMDLPDELLFYRLKG